MSTVVTIGLLAVLSGAFSSTGGVTAARVEEAVGPTFANLLEVQARVLGRPPLQASEVKPMVTCHKLNVATSRDSHGAGDWMCNLVWTFPGRRTPLHDTYDVAVTADGCFTASADGAEAHVGGPTLPGADGAPVVNLLYTFEGCFDTT